MHRRDAVRARGQPRQAQPPAQAHQSRGELALFFRLRKPLSLACQIVGLLEDVAVAKAIKFRGKKRFELTAVAQATKDNAGRSLCLVMGISEPKTFENADAVITSVSQVYDEIEVQQ